MSKKDRQGEIDYRSLPGFETKTIPTYVKSVDEPQGIVEHIISVFGIVDDGMDVVMPGSFAKSIVEHGSRVKVLDQHNLSSALNVVGKPISIREIGREELPAKLLMEYPEASGGVLATTQYALKTDNGRNMFELISGGYLPETSIGYDALDTVDETRTIDGKEVTVRLLKTIRLWEYSNVIFGMCPATQTVATKEGKPAPEITENTIRIRVRDPGDFEDDSFRTITIGDEDEGIQAVVGRLKGEDSTTVQSYIFDKEKWTVAEAQRWVDAHKDKAPDDLYAERKEVKFTGSPRNPYGTHSSRGYPGGRDAWKRAWRIHMSRQRDQGPIQGTVRRVSMISAAMKPKCALPEMSADDLTPRAGACGELSGTYKETPSDYGLSHWKKPSDDDLTDEDVRLTCQDLEDLKRICLQEIAKRKACEEEGKNINVRWEDIDISVEPTAFINHDTGEVKVVGQYLDGRHFQFIWAERKIGRVFSAANVSRIQGAIDNVQSALSDLESMLAEVAGTDDTETNDTDKQKAARDGAGPATPPTSSDADDSDDDGAGPAEPPTSEADKLTLELFRLKSRDYDTLEVTE